MQSNRLTRSRNDQMIAGVCSGLAQYFGTDATLVRLGFVLLTFLGVGTTIPLYLILWVVLPVEGAPQLPGHNGFQQGLEEMKNSFQQAASKVKQNFQNNNQPSNWRYDPHTGQPINQPTIDEAKPRFDPYTGQPLDK